MTTRGSIKALVRQIRAVRAELAECEARAATGDAVAATMATALRRDLAALEARVRHLFMSAAERC